MATLNSCDTKQVQFWNWRQVAATDGCKDSLHCGCGALATVLKHMMELLRLMHSKCRATGRRPQKRGKKSGALMKKQWHSQTVTNRRNSLRSRFLKVWELVQQKKCSVGTSAQQGYVAFVVDRDPAPKKILTASQNASLRSSR